MRRALALMVFTLALVPALYADQASLRVGWEEWRPYQYRDENGRLTGLDVELMRAIADRAGYRLFWYEVAWERHLWEVAAGSIDLALGASRTDRREAYGHFSIPYRTEAVSLISRFRPQEELDRSALVALLDNDRRLGYVSGYSYVPWVNSLIARQQAGLVATQSEDYLASALVQGQLDGFFADAFAAVASIEAERQAQGIERPVYTTPLLETDIQLLLSRQSVTAETLAELNEAIRAMRADGSLDAIIARYLR